MTTSVKPPSVTVVPCLRYRNAPKAIEWLCQTFGFERQLIVPADNETIRHAQLSLGSGTIMIGSVPTEETEWSRHIKQPDEIGGFETQSVYLVVSDADEIYGRAKDAGADIAIEIKDEDYGGRGFSCRDLEGHLWSIGTYAPG
jgi:uncharacterized glyoxalase superfamily protein PhnB